MTGEHPHAGERRSEAAGASCPVVPSHKLPGDNIAALSVCVMTPETCPPRAHGHRRALQRRRRISRRGRTKRAAA